jgi:hypothetical protein
VRVSAALAFVLASKAPTFVLIAVIFYPYKISLEDKTTNNNFYLGKEIFLAHILRFIDGMILFII